MNTQELIRSLNSDLQNERKHLMFYLHASTMVKGLHREEISEFLLNEAKSELEHVKEFSEMVVYLGGKLNTNINPYPVDLTCPRAILTEVVKMEEEVADIYAKRLRDTHEMESAEVAAIHVFYEEQIADSWKTAKEVQQMLSWIIPDSSESEADYISAKGGHPDVFEQIGVEESVRRRQKEKVSEESVFQEEAALDLLKQSQKVVMQNLNSMSKEAKDSALELLKKLGNLFS